MVELEAKNCKINRHLPILYDHETRPNILCQISCSSMWTICYTIQICNLSHSCRTNICWLLEGILYHRITSLNPQADIPVCTKKQYIPVCVHVYSSRRIFLYSVWFSHGVVHLCTYSLSAKQSAIVQSFAARGHLGAPNALAPAPWQVVALAAGGSTSSRW